MTPPKAKTKVGGPPIGKVAKEAEYKSVHYWRGTQTLPDTPDSPCTSPTGQTRDATVGNPHQLPRTDHCNKTHSPAIHRHTITLCTLTLTSTLHQLGRLPPALYPIPPAIYRPITAPALSAPATRATLASFTIYHSKTSPLYLTSNQSRGSPEQTAQV